jgi:hypothetical protein
VAAVPTPIAPVEAAPAQRGRPIDNAPANRRQQAAAPAPGARGQATGKIAAWNAASKTVTLDNNTSCTLAANVAAPADIAVGKGATLSYTTANNANTCNAISVR